MKSTTFALVSLLTSAAIAQPHRHQHQAKHQKRDETVVWVTDYDYVTETVDVTTTIWVTEGFVEPTAPAPAQTTPKTSTTFSTSTSAVAAQFFEPASLPAVSPSSSTTTPVYVAPVQTPAYVAPTTSAAPVPTTSTTPVYVAPVVEPSSSPAAQVYTQPAAPVVQPTTTAAAAAAAAVQTQASAASSSSSETYTGDITYYDVGLGACGWTNTANEKVVALPHGLMGTQSNGNPFCGRMITITCIATGKTTTAKVVDKCMGCEDYAIDLSNGAFDAIADEAVGRTKATWSFL